LLNSESEICFSLRLALILFPTMETIPLLYCLISSSFSSKLYIDISSAIAIRARFSKDRLLFLLKAACSVDGGIFAFIASCLRLIFLILQYSSILVSILFLGLLFNLITFYLNEIIEQK